MQHPKGEDIYSATGKIIAIDDFEFEHTLDIRSGSSGSPICLITNRLVIGIHKSGNKSIHINQGTFIGTILEKLDEPLVIIVQSSLGFRGKIVGLNPKDNVRLLKDKIRDLLLYKGEITPLCCGFEMEDVQTLESYIEGENFITLWFYQKI